MGRINLPSQVAFAFLHGINMKHVKRIGLPAQLLLLSVATFTCLTQARAQSVDQKLFGGHTDDLFGHSIDGGKDLDGDGVPDFVVGAPSDQATATGRVEVYSGKTRTLLYTLYGTSNGDQFGSSVALVGDLDGDGKPDLLVGAVRPGYAGYVKAYKGTNGTLLYTITGSTCDNFGATVKAIGDVNGDGVEDFAVAAPNATRQTGDCLSSPKGRVTVYSGSDGSSIFSSTGSAYGDSHGKAIGAVGDVNGDGTPDIAVWGYGYTPTVVTPYIKVYSGSSHSVLYTVANISDFQSAAGQEMIAAVGDIDGDGKPDFLIGNGLKVIGTQPFGTVRLVSGANGTVIRETVPDATYNHFGYSVVSLGDMNGDGVPDFLVGGSQTPNGNYPHWVRILSGADLSVLNEFYGSAGFEDEFGFSLATIGDTNSDGKAEYIIGGREDKNVYSREGSISLYGLRPDFAGFKLIRKGGVTPKTVIVPSN